MKVVADANVLLSALIGGQASRLLCHPAIEEVLTTEFTLIEVQSARGIGLESVPVWSNDKDFEDTDVVRYSTASLLALVEPQRA